MIFAGSPEKGLQEHQQDAYKAVTSEFKTGNRAAVVVPTGCGKSFIALQLMEDNKDKNILFMAPTIAIKNQMYRYIAKYIVGEKPTKGRTARQIAEEHFPNLKIMLYPTLAKMDNEKMSKLNPDIIIMDELHRTAADKWGPKIDTLLDMNPNAKVLGLTATPDRMDNKDVIDRIFEGKIAYELTLVDAIKRGIVKPPKYVKCDYALGEMLENVKEQIELCDDETTKKELQAKYDRMRRIVDQAEGIPQLFAENMTKKDGKYIVFCKDKEHMAQMMEEAKKWFADIDSEPEMYSVYSRDGSKENQEVIKRFEESKSKHLKLLFSIDMLNEGLHVEDISGVIMLRPTDSRTIYLQQLGRALSSDKTREQTIIFDLVNNYLKNNLDREVNARTKREENNEGGKRREKTDPIDQEQSYDDSDIDIFRIQGETKEFLELFDEIDKTLARSGINLRNARAIKAWMKSRNTTKPPSSTSKDIEERTLGKALNHIKQSVIKPYKDKETEEEKEEHRSKYTGFDEIISIVEEIEKNNISPYLANAREIKAWMEARKTTKPPSAGAIDPEERTLGIALGTIKREAIKPYKDKETEEEKAKYKETHPELDEIMQIVSEIEENNIPQNLVNARAIKAWMEERKTTKPPTASSKDKKEKTLGDALGKLRIAYVNPYKKATEEKKAEMLEEHPEIIEIMEIIDWIDENNLSPYLVNARKIKEWYDKNKKYPNEKSTDEKEIELAKAFCSIRQGLIRRYMKLKKEEEREQYRKKYPELDEVFGIITEIDLNIGNPKRRLLAELIREDLKKRETVKKALEIEAQVEAEQKGKGVVVGDG